MHSLCFSALWLAGVFYWDKSAVLHEFCTLLCDSDGELHSAHSRDTIEIPIEFSCAVRTTDCSITDAVLWELLPACLSAHVSKHTLLRAQGWRKKKKDESKREGDVWKLYQLGAIASYILLVPFSKNRPSWPPALCTAVEPYWVFLHGGVQAAAFSRKINKQTHNHIRGKKTPFLFLTNAAIRSFFVAICKNQAQVVPFWHKCVIRGRNSRIMHRYEGLNCKKKKKRDAL